MQTNLTLVVSQISLCQVLYYQDQNSTTELAVGLILLLVSQQSAIFEPPLTSTYSQTVEMNTR